MLYIDKETNLSIEVFTTKVEDKGEQYTGVEVCTVDGVWVGSMGCYFEDDSLIDYDGDIILPTYVIEALRKAGWKVPKEFLDN